MAVISVGQRLAQFARAPAAPEWESIAAGEMPGEFVPAALAGVEPDAVAPVRAAIVQRGSCCLVFGV